MALDFSRFNFLRKLDARARVFFLLAGFFAVIVIIYLSSRFLFGGGSTTGPSRVAAAPGGLESVQGGTLTPEYQRALMQANTQAAEQARMSGTSAVPTLINIGQQPNAANCIICSDELTNVKPTLDDWVKQGRMTPELAAYLQQLADKNVAEEEYGAALNDLIKQGKMTPEQARLLLEQYKKQHANRMLQDSAKVMDGMMRSGKLPVDVANALLEAQKRKVSPSDYAGMLQGLVRQGKISPSVAAQLLAQYTQQRAREIIQQSIAILRQMLQGGQLTADVEKEIEELEMRMVPVDVFMSAIEKFVTAGKMTPAVAKTVIDEYKDQKAQIGPIESINDLLKRAEEAAYQEISDLLKAKKITQDTANTLASMIQRDVSLEEFIATVNQLVTQKKLTPEIAKLKIADYQLIKGLREMAKVLAELQGNNASPGAYGDALKRFVQAGIITPAQAAELMQEYLALSSRAPLPTTGGGTDEFSRLQQRVQEGAAGAAPPPATEFAAAETQAAELSTQDRLSRIQSLMAAMSGQAQQLIAAWQPPVMVHREGSPEKEAVAKGGAAGAAGGKSTTTTTTTTDMTAPPLIKSGTVIFAVLDTQANSDYPDSPVMATVVEGKYKGAKLLGKLVTTKGVAGQMDRIALNFTLMNMDVWPRSKTITAYGIDPDTARTVMASDVNYHYLKRFGAVMATSFLQGYASALTTSGSTSTTGIFGTSSTYPQLDPRSKFLVGLGQVGQTLGNTTQNWVNIPPTVRVDPGVGLGILFMSDVS